MENNRKKLGLAAAGVVGLLALSGGAVAFAQSSTPSPGPSRSTSTVQEGTTTPGSQEQDQEGTSDKGGKEGSETTFVGSVKAPAENQNEAEKPDGSAEDTAQKKAEADALAKLATVTQDQASKAATTLVPGTLQKAELGDKDGYVVWEIDIAEADGTKVEVIVDAGNVGNLIQEVD